MAYRREYPSAPQRKKRRKPLGLALLLAAVLMLCSHPSVRKTAMELLIPGDRQVTWQALETMAEELRRGEPLGEAAEAFCLEILSHGN